MLEAHHTHPPARRHQWRRMERPPGRHQCATCGACSQVFPTRALIPEHRSAEAGTTLYRAPGKTPPGWWTRSGPCVPGERAGLPLLEALELLELRAAWSSLEAAEWVRGGITPLIIGEVLEGLPVAGGTTPPLAELEP